MMSMVLLMMLRFRIGFMVVFFGDVVDWIWCLSIGVCCDDF